MNRLTRGPDRAGEKGVALIYMAVTLTSCCLQRGCRRFGQSVCRESAADQGRGRGGARSGASRQQREPEGRGRTDLQGEFPRRLHGDLLGDGSHHLCRFLYPGDREVNGRNIVTITASTILPTTFMKLGNFHEVTVGASGQATRRMVDLSLVLDVSSSIGWRWPYVRDGARSFVDSFDQVNDRMSLTFFGNGARVLDAMPSSRGFDKAQVKAHSPKWPSRGQHQHGGGPLSSLGRIEGRARRSAVEPSDYRALHRRRLQQRPWRPQPGARARKGPEMVGLPGQRGRSR